ncbi:helix-turn-helix domain-containing protein [Fulvivirga marina]|uniref:helix-turn-helix domain-containing protein n=1 Tax=Fulvivirga marina TaxID=2494733 RepID=UPI003742A7D4
MSQGELAKMLNTSTSVIGRYERDEMTPSIEVAKKLLLCLILLLVIYSVKRRTIHSLKIL